MVNNHAFLFKFLIKTFKTHKNNQELDKVMSEFINAKDRDGQTPLLIALKNKRNLFAKKLLSS